MFYCVSYILHHSNFLMALSFKLIVSKLFSIPEIFGLLAPCCRQLQLKAGARKTHLQVYV